MIQDGERRCRAPRDANRRSGDNRVGNATSGSRLRRDDWGCVAIDVLGAERLLLRRFAVHLAWYGIRTKQVESFMMAKETPRPPGAKKTSKMLCGIEDGFRIAYAGEGVRPCFSESIN